MALGRAVLVLLVLSPLLACGAALLQPGLPRGGQWVWGAAKPLPLSREKRDDRGQEPGATAMISSDKSRGVSLPPPAPGTTGSLLRVPATAEPMDDSPEPELLLSSAAPAPSTNASLIWVPAVSTTAEPMDETDPPDLSLLQVSAVSSTAEPMDETEPPDLSLIWVPAVSTTAEPMDETDPPDLSLLQVSAVSSTAEPMDETDPPDLSLIWVPAVSTTAEPMDETDPPDLSLLPTSAPPPAPSTKASRAFMVPTTADPMDETDSPAPDLLPASEPAPSAAQKSSATATPSWLTSPIEEGTVTDGPDSSSSTGPRSTPPPAFVLTTTGYKKRKEFGAPPAPTLPTPGGTAAPWEPSGVMSKCLLAMLLLGLVAATFLVCTGVLGTLLWRRAQRGQRRYSPTEMVCISSLQADAEAAAGPRPVPARRHKLLLPDGNSEPDGDNLTLSSFLPEHS